MTDPSGNTTTWVYDSRGRLIDENKTIDGELYHTGWCYSSADLPVTMSYPDGQTITTGYLPQMAVNMLYSIPENPLVSETNYDASGRIQNRILNNGGFIQYFDYNPWTTANQGGRLAHTTYGTNVDPTLFNDLSYTYLATGSISTIQNAPENPTEKWQYTYDGINRLTQDCLLDAGGACTAPTPYGYDYGTGNLVTLGSDTLTYNAHTHPHAVMSTTGGGVYTYDANGNQITRLVGGVSYTLAYDEENRLTGISSGSLATSYVYDGDGNRVKTVVNGVTTIYIGNYYEVINPGASQVVKKYYYAGGTRVAMSEDGVIRYFVTDHLGGTTKLVNTDGSEYSAMSYLSWGSDRLTPPDIGTDFKYTGQREAEAGLYFYNARYYDPAVGRFIQADTIIPDPENPLAWDRYAYTMNSPLNYTDPSGNIACEDQGTLGGNGYVCSNERPLPRRETQNTNTIINRITQIYKNFNWLFQTFSKMTLYKTPGFPFISGGRFYFDMSIKIDNKSPVTIGPKSSVIGPLKVSATELKIVGGPSSIGPIPDVFFNDIAYDFDYSVQYEPISIWRNISAQPEFGVQAINRPGNSLVAIGVAVTVVGIYILPEVAVPSTIITLKQIETMLQQNHGKISP